MASRDERKGREEAARERYEEKERIDNTPLKINE